MSRISYRSTKIVDGAFEDHLSEFERPAPRTLGSAVRALDARKGRFSHPATIIARRVDPRVVCVIDRRVDAVLNEWANAVRAEFVAEGFRVVAPVSSEAEQVAGVTAGDLRPDPRVVFLRGRAVNVGDVQCLNINERSNFQRADAVVRSLSVVPRGLIAVEASG